MSLYLPEQKLGSHSEPMSSSHKFMLKGRQTGSMHRGHTWIFRAESHDTMMAWFADIKELTETTPSQRNEFVRRTHARSLSGNSLKAASVGGSSDGGLEEDEADRVPYSSEQSVRGTSVPPVAAAGLTTEGVGGEVAYDHDDARSEAGWRPPQRPSPGGRFPSEVNVARGLQEPASPSSGESDGDRTAIAGISAMPGSEVPHGGHGYAQTQGTPTKSPRGAPVGAARSPPPAVQTSRQHTGPGFGAFDAAQHHGGDGGHEGQWLAPIAAGAGGAALGAGVMHHHNHHEQQPEPLQQETNTVSAPYPTSDTDATPMPVVGVTSMTDSPANGHAATASSTDDTVVTLSTVPTSVEQNDGSYFDKNGAWVAAHTNVNSATGQAITPQMGKVEALGMRPPAMTAKSVTTISDLHVPGEFPNNST